MNLSPRQRFILNATCGYLAFGSAWILLSDRLLLSFTDIQALTRLSMAKGITFILLTALLLLIALSIIPDRTAEESRTRLRSIIIAGSSDRIPRWAAYLFAVAVSVGMLFLRQGIAVSFGERPMLILFIPPIILSSVLGGLGPGLVATAISAFGINYFAIPPVHSLRIEKEHDLFQWCMLIASGLLSSYLSELLHRARRQAERRRIRQELAKEEIHRLNAELEQRVALRTAELTAANAELESFAYAVSHDLRAPLRAMSGFSQALIEDYGSQLQGEARTYLDQIIIGSRRMGELIDGILALSRVTRGELRRDPVDLSAIAERILAGLAAEEPAREVEWLIEPGLVACGDERMLEAVLRNLLENAWKYTGNTERAIIRFVAREQEGTRYYCVEDNGAGFENAHAGKLFQPFQRLHRQDEYPGLGIGLATAQRIIHRHGGTIHGAGSPESGASFCFALPDSGAQETQGGQ
jgi:K+-sensing histidine kinase KdpD